MYILLLANTKDDIFQNYRYDSKFILRSLSTLMFVNLTQWNANQLYLLKNGTPCLWCISIFFSNSVFDFYGY